MLSTGSLKGAPLLASCDSDIFALVAANGRAMVNTKRSAGGGIQNRNPATTEGVI